jgi:aminopeptidase N
MHSVLKNSTFIYCNAENVTFWDTTAKLFSGLYNHFTRRTSLKDAAPVTIHLKDYQKPSYDIETVDLEFQLDLEKTIVKNTMKIKRTEGFDASAPLELFGEDMDFLGLKVNGKEIEASDFELGEKTLSIKNLPDTFTLEVENQINPKENTILEGLYASGNILCTQNEPEGFRRITYFLDRPDVMAKYTTKIVAKKSQFPVLLSNGNPVDKGDLEDGMHFVKWEDPFAKPSYLYALVAGDLGLIEDKFTTMSGREVLLQIYCDKGNEDKCGHAMESLKNSMKWDEERFGLEYDLDIYMIVAVDSFNMGAMENKGLNIFNSSLVLARPDTATDGDFLAIESVVGHEYFHNWTGNRVTCRDWFQLTLKEGLTVFRDQEFSSDLNSRPVKRIEDVKILRQYQFTEDAGPMSHPIKPSSYIEINNFYTATVYDKGSEVIRMIQTLLGRDGFRKGIDKYFELFDGQAVTTEDFIHAMSVANNDYDFSMFKKWYSQSGTPRLTYSGEYDSDKKEYKLKLSQETRSTPNQSEKEALLLPLDFGLVGQDGKDLKVETDSSMVKDSLILFDKAEDEIVFKNVDSEPVVSMNRGFSAPIIVASKETEQNLAFLMANDSDGFNRYESAQKFYIQQLEKSIEASAKNEEYVPSDLFAGAIEKVLLDKDLEYSTKAYTLTVPDEVVLLQKQDTLDFKNTHSSCQNMLQFVGNKFYDQILGQYESLQDKGDYKLDPVSVGKRVLRSRFLKFLASTGKKEAQEIAYKQFQDATNMTERFGALAALAYYPNHYTEKALDEFYGEWKNDSLVMQKWLAAQSSCPLDLTYDRILNLEENPVFDVKVPNLVRSLYGPFVMNNYVQFHHDSGRGYELLADRMIKIDKINALVSARLASAFKDYSRLPSNLQGMMSKQLDRVLEVKGLSKNTYEVVKKTIESIN